MHKIQPCDIPPTGMKNRTLTTVIAVLLLFGMVTPSLGAVFACRLATSETSTCPMMARRHAEALQHVSAPVKAAVTNASTRETHSCCAGRTMKSTVATVAESAALSGACCCQKATSDSADQPAVIPVWDTPLGLPASTPLLVAVPIAVETAVALPERVVVAPRGPPPLRRSPRAPPALR